MSTYEDETDSRLPHNEEKSAVFAEREKCLKNHIQDLEKAYTVAMDLVKAAPKETLATVGATYRPLAMQDAHPNTRDLVAAILQRASSE
jgi:hypothetical protein